MYLPSRHMFLFLPRMTRAVLLVVFFLCSAHASGLDPVVLDTSEPGQTLWITAAGMSNPLSSGTNARLYEIFIGRTRVDLNKIALSDGWELRRDDNLQVDYITNHGGAPASLRIPVAGETVRLKFLKSPDGGYVVVKGAQEPQIIDLFSNKLSVYQKLNRAKEWVKVDVALKRQSPATRWTNPQTLSFSRSLLRQTGVVKSYDGKSLNPWLVDGTHLLDPWPMLEYAKISIPSTIELYNFHLPRTASLAMSLMHSVKWPTASRIQVHATFVPDDGTRTLSTGSQSVEVSSHQQKIMLAFENAEESYGRLSLTFSAAAEPNTDLPKLNIIDPVVQGIHSNYSGQRKNIIIIIMDTTRFDHLSIYGYERATTPFLEEMANTLIIFDNAYAQAPVTIPSHYSIFTSRYCKDLGVWNNKYAFPLPSEELTLAEVLQSAGWRTGAAVSINPIGSLSGLQQGFDHFYDCFVHNQRGEVTNRNAKQFLVENCDRPFFLWVHYFDAHVPYQPPPAYRKLYWEEDGPQSVDFEESLLIPGGREKYFISLDIEYNIAMYDASLRYQDDNIRDLFETLRTLHLMDNTIVVLAADHGESLGGEHGLYFKHAGLFEQVIHVPLILYVPGHDQAGERVSRVVENVDIAPTVLDLVGIRIPDRFRGKALLGSNRSHDNTAFFETSTRGFRKGNLKFLDERNRGKGTSPDNPNRLWNVAPEFMLFDVEKDPEEKRNLLNARDTSDIEKNLQFLGKWLEKDIGLGKGDEEEVLSSQEQVNPELLESLKALGYIQ